MEDEPRSPHTVVVGGGVLGLITALTLTNLGRSVTVIEASSELGGLTSTVQLTGPQGPLECDAFYHVVLESDGRLLRLLRDHGLDSLVRWSSTRATVVKSGEQYPASTLGEMASLPVLGVTDRVRVGLSIAASLILPSPMGSRMTSISWLGRMAGTRATQHFWRPILRAKLGTAATQVNANFVAATFRRLVRARLSGAGDRFGIITGGYGPVFSRLRSHLTHRGVRFVTGVAAERVTSGPGGPAVHLANGSRVDCTDVVITTPGPVAASILPDLTEGERRLLTEVPYLGVVCAAVLLKAPPNDSYITYLIDDLGLTGIIGMHVLTGGSAESGYLVYLPRYCSPDDPWFDETDSVLLDRLLRSAREAIPAADWAPIDAVISRARHVVPLPVPGNSGSIGFQTSVQNVHILSAVQNTTGTLNVEGSLDLAARGLPTIIRNLS